MDVKHHVYLSHFLDFIPRHPHRVAPDRVVEILYVRGMRTTIQYCSGNKGMKDRTLLLEVTIYLTVSISMRNVLFDASRDKHRTSELQCFELVCTWTLVSRHA